MLQDWLDIVWQSAKNAKDKGLDVRFVILPDGIGIRIPGVVVREGRPYLNTTVVEVEEESVVEPQPA